MTDLEYARKRAKRWEEREITRQKKIGLGMIILGTITLPCGVGFFILPLGIQLFRANEAGWLAD